MLLDGKKVLITGGSRGIGKAIVETFVEHGASVLITGRSDDLFKVAGHISSETGKVIPMQGDICDDTHVQDVVKACRKHFGYLDVLINNAGILQQALLGMIKIGAVREMIDVNVIAPINLTQYAIRLMRKSTSPSIINIASIAGTQGIDGITAYSASKAAVVGFTLSSAKELAPRGIRVNAIAPGFIDTSMTRMLPEQWYQERINNIRLGQKIGSPYDIANCALFLASDLASYITGQIIGVDGGMNV